MRILVGFTHNKEFFLLIIEFHKPENPVIIQNNCPLAFYSRKLTPTQRDCTIGERELLCIIETLREFCDMLCAMKLNMFEDHQNLTFNMSNPRVLRWRLLIEQCDYVLKCIKGKDNVIADLMSRIHTLRNEDSLFTNDTFYSEP